MAAIARIALVSGVALACLVACVRAPAATAAQIRLATWNLEWLISPEDALALRQRCRRGEKRLPCDVVQEGARSAADFDALARHAAALRADVVALQEVDGPAAAKRVFPDARFCFTQRRDWQNVGFAIRPGVPFRCEPDVASISLGDRVRRGAAVTLYPGDPREIRLLAVHLKSGCSREPLDSRARSCRQLAGQAPGVAGWIAEQTAAGRAFAVLGDFNRDLRGEAETGTGMWAQLVAGAPTDVPLVDAGAGTPFRACHSGQPFTRYIDYILLGGGLAARMRPGTFTRHVYDDRDAHHFRLSDHCPLSVAVRLR
jgi:endonuclease/exonuclease/phosphatase family metal-dependent hydrolase